MPQTLRRHRLIDIEWPSFGGGPYPPRPDLAEFEERLRRAREAMDRSGFTHLVVYGDREHFANLAWLTGIDPRFEEMLLILSARPDPLIVVGNECEGYLPHSPLFGARRLRHERFQPFSLLNQPRSESRKIREIFADEGIGTAACVGCVGWKYFGDSEHPDSRHAVDLPAYLVDALRGLAGHAGVVNGTDLFMNPHDGLRTVCSPTEIAYFEWSNVQASEGLRRMLFGMRVGMTDHELSERVGWSGEPQGCHMTLATGNRPGLCGPTGARIRRGEPLSTNISYWGSNICRAGWIGESPRDLPPDAREYADAFAGPYFQVMAEWLGMLTIGRPAGELSQLIEERLPFERFGIHLNAGHLIHLEEWISSPMYPGSQVPIRSGMAIQVDVIPVSKRYFSTRMEDGVIVADASLREEIRNRYPDCFDRIQRRRGFMADTLGIDLPPEVLPLSNIPAIVPPFFLKPGRVFALER